MPIMCSCGAYYDDRGQVHECMSRGHRLPIVVMEKRLSGTDLKRGQLGYCTDTGKVILRTDDDELKFYTPDEDLRKAMGKKGDQ